MAIISMITLYLYCNVHFCMAKSLGGSFYTLLHVHIMAQVRLCTFEVPGWNFYTYV